MSAVALRERTRPEQAGQRPDRLFDPGPVTLEERLSALSESLALARSAPCPVCGGRLDREDRDRAICSDCGSSLE